MTHAEPPSEDPTEHPTDLDSHADPCVVGEHVLIDHALDKKVNVTGFDPYQGKAKDLDLVSAALAYDCPTTGKVNMLMAHQSVHVPTMENDLLCPMQMRMNDAELHECSKFMEGQPSDMPHSLRVTNWSLQPVRGSILLRPNRNGTRRRLLSKSRKTPLSTPVAWSTTQGTETTGNSSPVLKCRETKPEILYEPTPNAPPY